MVFWDCRTWRGSQIGLPRQRHRMFPYTYTQYRGINVIWDSTKLWVVRDWASWLHPTQNATDIGISQGTPGTGRQCDAWPKSVGVVGRAVFQYKKRVFRLLWKPCLRKIRDSLTTILKPSNSKAFSNYWIDCSTLFVTLSAYRGHLIYTFTHLLFLLFMALKRAIKRWDSNVLAYTFTLFKVVYNKHFLLKTLKI